MTYHRAVSRILWLLAACGGSTPTVEPEAQPAPLPAPVADPSPDAPPSAPPEPEARTADPSAEALTQSLWATSRHDVWFVGGSEILHFDGERVRAHPLPEGTHARLFGVWAAGPRDAWVVGSGGLALHFDGAGWTPRPTGLTSDLFAVWGAAPDVVLVADTFGPVVRWDGAAFSEPEPTGAFPYHLSGSGPDDVLAGGARGRVARFDGTSWSAVGAFTRENLRGLCVPARDLAYALDVTTRVHRWDGSTWSPMDRPGGAGRAERLWASEDGHVFVSTSEGAVLHHDGRGWTRHELAANRGERPILMGLHGLSATDVFVAGRGTLFHWDGQQWAALWDPQARRVDGMPRRYFMERDVVSGAPRLD